LAIRRLFHGVNPALPVLDPRTLADQVDGATLVGGLAALALAIAGLTDTNR